MTSDIAAAASAGAPAAQDSGDGSLKTTLTASPAPLLTEDMSSPSGSAAAATGAATQPARGRHLALPVLEIPETPLPSPPPPSPSSRVSIPSLDKNAKVGPQNFEKIRILGAGATGRVYLVKSIGLPTEDFYAMKVVKKSELVKRNRVQRILTEKQILSVANHPFVVTLQYSFQTPEYFYLIMQYCAGGEFFSFLRRQEKHRLSEAHAKFYASEVLIALEYLHLLGIIYRDLKPENILVHESGHVMLSDFDLAHEVKTSSGVAVSPINSFMNVSGFSSSSSPTHASGGAASGGCGSSSSQPPTSLGSVVSLNALVQQENSLWFRVVDRKRPTLLSARPAAVRSPSCMPFKCLCGTPITYPMMDTESHMALGEKRTSFVGTHEYVAPEIIAEEGYVGSVDWWAFGILLYEMIYGTTPFKGSTQIQTLENILDLSEEIDFPSDVEVSEDYKDIVRKLLDKTVHRRLQNPLEIKAHPFFQDIVWPLIRHQKPPIVPDFVHTLKEKQFSIDEIDTFDDEVPYAQGVSSPNTPRRKRQASSSCASPRTPSMGTAGAGATSPADLHFTFDSAPGAPAAAISDTAASPQSSPTKESSPQKAVDGNSLYTSNQSDQAAATAEPPTQSETVNIDGSPVIVHNFDYAGGSKPGYWSSAESSRTLHQKLSEMRLATPEEFLDSQRD